MGRRRVLLTGCSGYLAQGLIRSLQQNPDVEWLGGIDVRPPRIEGRFHYFHFDVCSSDLQAIFKQHRVDTVVHLAWIFNPTHKRALEHRVDVEGTRNVLQSAAAAGVRYLLYPGSTTAYGPHPDNPVMFDEDHPRRGHRGYLYSAFKAEVDAMALDFMHKNADVKMLMLRACIVMGPGTNNVVTRMAQLPVMFGVRGYDPPMQFLHEDDLQRVFAWAIDRQPTGVYNLAGHETTKYSECIRIMRKPGIWIPPRLLYPSLGFTWRLRLLPFPPSMLDFIRYPWNASPERFEKAFPEMPIKHTTREAFLAFANRQTGKTKH